jgi:hypothetical protein
MNDVSMLFPIAAPNEASLALRPDDAGPKGLLFPRGLYDRFRVLDRAYEPDVLYRKALKVVGLRIDPCFREGAATACRHQIRLVWQPIVEKRGNATALDAAFHTFYEFSDAGWAELVTRWRGLARGDSGEPLQIQPMLRREGYRGPFWKALKEIVLAACGERNLVRITQMNVTAAQTWIFNGLDFDGREWKRLAVPRTNSFSQTILLSGAPFETVEFRGAFAPVPRGSAELAKLITDSVEFKRVSTPASASAAMADVIASENPNRNDPGTLDCVSCHVAQTARLWGARNFPDLDWKGLYRENGFATPMNVENRSVRAANTNRFRAFGYFDADPIFSDRVINETAAVAASLNRPFAARRRPR